MFSSWRTQRWSCPTRSRSSAVFLTAGGTSPPNTDPTPWPNWSPDETHRKALLLKCTLVVEGFKVLTMNRNVPSLILSGDLCCMLLFPVKMYSNDVMWGLPQWTWAIYSRQDFHLYRLQSRRNCFLYKMKLVNSDLVQVTGVTGYSSTGPAETNRRHTKNWTWN